MRRTIGLLSVGALLFIGCGDDGGPPPVVSRAEYQEEAGRLCRQHGQALSEAGAALFAGGQSDAELVASWRSEFVPRARAIVRGIVDFGLPSEGRQDKIEALNAALAALQQIETSPFRLIDRERRGDIVVGTEDDPFQQVTVAFAAAEIPC